MIVKRQNAGDVGSTQNQGSSSLSGLVSTLVPTLLISLAMVAVFLVLRRTEQRQYAPRTYLGSLPEQERTPALPKSFLGWIPYFMKVSQARTTSIRRAQTNEPNTDTGQLCSATQLPRWLLSSSLPQNLGHHLLRRMLPHLASSLPCQCHWWRWKVPTESAIFQQRAGQESLLW